MSLFCDHIKRSAYQISRQYNTECIYRSEDCSFQNALNYIFFQKKICVPTLPKILRPVLWNKLIFLVCPDNIPILPGQLFIWAVGDYM